MVMTAVQQVSSEDVFLERLASDPRYFMEQVLGEQPTERQVEIAEALRDHRRVAVRSAHAVGKSYVAARIALWFLYAHKNSVVVTTAPTNRQVVNVIWREIRRAHSRSKVALGGEILTKELRLDDGWFAFGFSTDDPDAISGIHAESGYILVVVDEAAGVLPDIYEAIEGLLTGPDARLLLIGNPTAPTGAFFEEFRAAGTHKIKIDAFDSPNVRAGKIIVPGLVDKTWIEDRRARWGESSPLYRARVMAEFPDLADDTLVALSWAEKAIERGKKPLLAEEVGGEKALKRLLQPVGLGIDVARFGSNETVMALRRGRRVKIISRRNGDDTMLTANRTANYAREKGASFIRVDDVGVGGGVTDRLREMKIRGVKGVNVGAPPKDPDRFVNLRAEMAWEIREAFENDEIDLEGEPRDIEDLVAQLTSIKYSFSNRGKIQIESKADMTRRQMPSPDVADAVILAWAPAPSYSLERMVTA